MSAPHLCLLCLVLFISYSVGTSTVQDASPIPNDLDKKVELFDGVVLKLPRNDTGRVLSLEIDTNRSVGEGRGKQKKLMERILPLFIMPFLIQSTIIPMFLSMLKFMLFKSMMVGKLALMLIVLNAFKNHNVVKGRDSIMANAHYGYHGNGMEEYGAYIN